MAFKMKGSPMHRNFGIGKAPLNQTAPSEDTKNPNYNQEIDQENADKVMEKRTSDLEGFREKAEGFEATSQEQVDKINAQDKKNMEAYNFSADSINTSNSNAADRLKADQAGDFDSLFKQKRTGPKDQSKNDPTNLGLGTTVTNPGAEVPGSPEVTTTKHIKGANPKSYSDLHNMPVPLDGEMTKEERARYKRFQASETPAKQGFKPSKVDPKKAIVGTKTDKMGNKSEVRRDDVDGGGYNKKNSPAKQGVKKDEPRYPVPPHLRDKDEKNPRKRPKRPKYKDVKRPGDNSTRERFNR